MSMPFLHLDWFNQSDGQIRAINSIKIGETWVYFFEDSLFAVFNHKAGDELYIFDGDLKRTIRTVPGLHNLMRGNSGTTYKSVIETVKMDIRPNDIKAVSIDELYEIAIRNMSNDIAQLATSKLTGQDDAS